MEPFVPSEYQKEIYKFVTDDQGSAVVIAVAGSGKTTTLLEALKLIPQHESVQLFAFNRAIADELRSRIPRYLSHIRANTFHSSGYRAICRHLGLKNIETNSQKLRKLYRAKFGWAERPYEGPVCQLVSLGKGKGIGALFPDDESHWRDLIRHHDLDLQSDDKVGIRLARTLLEASNLAAENEYSIDFDDQLYLPCLWDLPLDQSYWVMVDEAQDTNAIRRAFLKRSCLPGGRALMVGDPAQAIYGFSGASWDAIELLKREWQAKELPLSVSYRCPKSVVALAQTLVPYLECPEDAPDGSVRHERPSDVLQTLTKSDCVLCRNNAPLVALAYDCLARGIACQILGKDIGKGLSSLVSKMGAKDVDDLRTRLGVYLDGEIPKLLAKDEHAKAERLRDKVSCLETIISNLDQDCYTLTGLGVVLDSLFGDELGDRLTLSTVHKAKGKEWPTVAILAPELMPAYWARQPWEQQQERNVQYVAWTRAKQTLIFLVDSHKPLWEEEEEEVTDESLAGDRESSSRGGSQPE